MSSIGRFGGAWGDRLEFWMETLFPEVLALKDLCCDACAAC